ncbi:fasciclin domain-containing protein [Alteraurantiacibacter aestuarii]|uniref:Fasciclin domain-containing protein n=1 Tax=Alteraurantiacibacter aestuarii TaxID=650004 RepID=A0A844ZKI1_9SPHN|nr:fasciclin domain-containing protein [Alteraurantiacibacter aestuarii]MXO87530.1 fasciclin domain-containing protein [Alteraurantiacibacter aestuarii]
MTKHILTTLLAGAAFSLSACSEAAEAPVADDAAMADQTANSQATGTIVDVAVGNEDFSTLVAAVQAAGLVDTLSGAGPFTVFAPTNAAFAALPEGVVEELTTNDTETLASILTYHVVAGEVLAADVLAAIEGAGDAGFAITTVNGATLTATLVDGNVVLTDAAGNTATVVATDVDASNGVIHVIDTVLMPA